LILKDIFIDVRTHNPLVPGSSPGGPTNNTKLLEDNSSRSFFYFYYRLQNNFDLIA